MKVKKQYLLSIGFEIDEKIMERLQEDGVTVEGFFERMDTVLPKELREELMLEGLDDFDNPSIDVTRFDADNLTDRHWSECQMIANYDNEIGQAVKILEKLPKLHRAILLEAPAAAATMGSVLLESTQLLGQIKRTTYHEEKQETMTEADVIRNMTDDELAKFLNGVEKQGFETRGHEGAEFKGYGNANIAWWKGFLMNPAGEDY